MTFLWKTNIVAPTFSRTCFLRPNSSEKLPAHLHEGKFRVHGKASNWS